MPKRVTRRRHGGRDHNFPGRGAARSGAERSAAVGARPCQRGAGGLHGATGSTELPSSPSDVFTALRLHLPVRIMAYIYFSPSVFFFFPLLFNYYFYYCFSWFYLENFHLGGSGCVFACSQVGAGSGVPSCAQRRSAPLK